MATQLSAITLVGTTGQAYSTGLRFVQFYFGLPLAMIVLSLTVVPFFTRARVYHRVRVPRAALRCADAHGHQLPVPASVACFSLGVTLAAPAVVISAIVGWSIPMTRAGAGGADGVLHQLRRRAGRGVDRREADGGHRRRVCSRRSSSWSIGITRDVSLTPGARLAGATGRLQAIDMRFDPERNLHAVVGPDRRLLPEPVVLRLRPEPGAALPHGEVDRRRAPLAADERVREDSAAAARALAPACWCSCSTSSRRRRCCSTGARGAGGVRARAPASTPSLQQQFDDAIADA